MCTNGASDEEQIAMGFADNVPDVLIPEQVILYGNAQVDHGGSSGVPNIIVISEWEYFPCDAHHLTFCCIEVSLPGFTPLD